MTFSEEGRLIEREIRNDAAYASINHFESGDGGLTVLTLSEWSDNGQAHRTEEIVSFNEKGQMVSRKENLDGGPFTVYMKQEFDSDGHAISFLHCSTDGKYCSRTESEYDDQGRLKLTREIEFPSGRVANRTTYEYPGKNRKRTLDFDTNSRSRDVPASVPTWLTETTYDSAGRVAEEITSAPGLAWDGGCIDRICPGRVAMTYDEQGHVVDETDEAGGTHKLRTYNHVGNLISERVIQTGGSEKRSEFTYEYDRFGNWTSMTSYTSDSSGKREKPLRIGYQKITYYSQ